MKQTLWTRNFTLLTGASALGAAGGIAGGFALSFFVFEQTGSTLASALLLCAQLLPHVLIPLVVAPWMDRLPRKAFLVGGDVGNGLLYLAMGVYLWVRPFSYVGYLAVSVVVACLGAVDALAYQSIFPEVIPPGLEEKGYAVSGMLYPVLQVLMAPLAALLLRVLGVANLLLAHGLCALAAAALEAAMRLEEAPAPCEAYTLGKWWQDVCEGLAYLRREKGLRNLYAYMAVTNGMAQGYGPILVAFFSTLGSAGAGMYALFSVAEFAGRTLGSVLQYRIRIPAGRKFGVCFLVYLCYEAMDLLLLWLPYPLMLGNRALCGFLGQNSAVLRSAATQRYIPAQLRARVNACFDTLVTAAGSTLALLVGALGEVLPYRWCMALCAGVTMLACITLIWGGRRAIRPIYTTGAGEEAPSP